VNTTDRVAEFLHQAKIARVAGGFMMISAADVVAVADEITTLRARVAAQREQIVALVCAVGCTSEETVDVACQRAVETQARVKRLEEALNQAAQDIGGIANSVLSIRQDFKKGGPNE
jgi:hypothetical protein